MTAAQRAQAAYAALGNRPLADYIAAGHAALLRRYAERVVVELADGNPRPQPRGPATIPPAAPPCVAGWLVLSAPVHFGPRCSVLEKHLMSLSPAAPPHPTLTRPTACEGLAALPAVAARVEAAGGGAPNLSRLSLGCVSVFGHSVYSAAVAMLIAQVLAPAMLRLPRPALCVLQARLR